MAMIPFLSVVALLTQPVGSVASARVLHPDPAVRDACARWCLVYGELGGLVHPRDGGSVDQTAAQCVLTRLDLISAEVSALIDAYDNEFPCLSAGGDA